MKTNAELEAEINQVTSDWSVRGPYHESELPFYALLNGEWVGAGYETKRQALAAILSAVESKGAQK